MFANVANPVSSSTSGGNAMYFSVTGCPGPMPRPPLWPLGCSTESDRKGMARLSLRAGGRFHGQASAKGMGRKRGRSGKGAGD